MTPHTESQTKRSVVVTGAARGIGLAVAKKFASDGCSVALWDIDDSELAATAASVASNGASIAWARVDVTDPKSIASAYTAATASIGTPNVLVNNAGILGWRGPVRDLPLDMWQKVLAINVTGALLCSQAVVGRMQDAGWVASSIWPRSQARTATQATPATHRPRPP